MRILMLSVLAAIALFGCGTMEQAAQNECAALHLQPGTPAFATCYEQSMARRQASIDAAMQK